MRLFTKKSCYHQGVFAVKRRAVFILGAKWKTLVRGWRRDRVVGGMETRFQWRKAHSRTAKCEAFHVAPRLFFMFLFLITFTIRQQYNHCPSNFPLSSQLGRVNYGEGLVWPFLQFFSSAEVIVTVVWKKDLRGWEKNCIFASLLGKCSLIAAFGI